MGKFQGHCRAKIYCIDLANISDICLKTDIQAWRFYIKAGMHLIHVRL